MLTYANVLGPVLNVNIWVSFHLTCRGKASSYILVFKTIVINKVFPLFSLAIYRYFYFRLCLYFFLPQPVFLADFKQIKKVQCWPQSDGKALVHLDVEGARQVRGAAPSGQFSTLLVCLIPFFPTLQRLSINVPAVSVAENMMDLIDGYCRLEHDTDETVIYRPNKGARGQDCFLYHNKLG